MNATPNQEPSLESIVPGIEAFSSEKLLKLVDRLLELHDKKSLPEDISRRPRVELPNFDIDSASFNYTTSRRLYFTRLILKETGHHPEYYSAQQYESYEQDCGEAPHFVQILFRCESPDTPSREGLVDVTLRPKDMTIAFDIFLLGLPSGGDSRVSIDLTTGELRENEINRLSNNEQSA